MKLSKEELEAIKRLECLADYELEGAQTPDGLIDMIHYKVLYFIS